MQKKSKILWEVKEKKQVLALEQCKTKATTRKQDMVTV